MLACACGLYSVNCYHEVAVASFGLVNEFLLDSILSFRIDMPREMAKSAANMINK